MNNLRQKLSIQHGIPPKYLIHSFRLEPRYISTIKRYNSTIVKPLEGIRVLELGQLIAGPFCGSILGYYGADVIKIEPPNTGDPLRKWRGLDKDGQSPWFRSLARNKKSVCIDLRSEEGRSLVKQLALQSDVLIENFKPGTMEKWGLGPDHIYPENPSLIYTRISGYGQTGPYSKKPGFASVCEGVGGFRYVNGHPGQPPVRPNISLGDSLAGMHAALGVLLGLIARNKVKDQSRTGQVVDVSIYESVLNMMEGIIPEYDRFQQIRQPSGTTVTGIVPTNTYPCKDGKHVIIGGNGDSIYVRLMNAIGRSDLTGEKYKANSDRVREQVVIDGAIAEWTSKHTADEIIKALEEASVPVGKIYDAKDIVEDEHINARGMIETVKIGTEDEGRGWELKVYKYIEIYEQRYTC
ncbi:CoA-transferase family III [Rhizopus microsporus ATCC 52813]|uniref:CoA-transferase family III n=1 Tax=Rhizopus microsporus ATCC 52813 TaxID=1340429 RepID=A0A2G4SZB8_RHIZD|nr:CoA-transferase family III [Rhizopus microsporus ATCC 52813]PHZ14122.1 CoA-transferase family III [Rhizopus microsporus ATCC 52813]